MFKSPLVQQDCLISFKSFFFHKKMDRDKEDMNFENSLSNPNFVPVMEPFVMYKRRWIGLICIWLLNFAYGFVLVTFTAVPQISSNWFNTGASEVTLTATLYFAGAAVATPFSGFVFEKFGIKKALMLGALINVAGSWIRYVAVFIESSEASPEPRVAVVLIGQFIAAIASPFVLIAPPKYAAVWFSESSRATATSIGNLSNSIAAAVAMLVIPAILVEENGDDMPLTLLLISICSSVAFLLTLTLSDQPPTPPSASASWALAENAVEPFWIAIKKISTNINFWILFTGFTIYGGVLGTLSSLVNQIIGPYGYSPADGGTLGIFIIAAGIPGGLLAGIFLDKTKRYRTVLFICAPLLTLAFGALIFVIREDFYTGIAVVFAVLGFTGFALGPAALEIGVECTYPAPPSSSSSILWMGGQISPIVFTLVADALRDDDGEPPGNMRTALIAGAVICALAAASTFFYNAPNRRLEAEKAAVERPVITAHEI